MLFCQCNQSYPRYGPGTVTDYAGTPILYRLCSDCGQPVALSGTPPPEDPLVQRRRWAMRRTIESA